MNKIILIITALFVITACDTRDPARVAMEDARADLEKAGVEYSLESFIERIRENDIASVNLFLQTGPRVIGWINNLSSRYLDYDTPFTAAVRWRRPEIIRSFIDAGADFDRFGRDRFTPLALAVKTGQNDIALMLLEAGADVNPDRIIPPSPNTPLMYAMREGNMEIVSALLEAGAEVNETNDDGRTALMLAALWGHRDAVRALLEAGAEVDVEDNYGHTALTRAAWRSDPEITAILEGAGAEIAAEDINGDLALISAAGDGNPEVVSELIKTGSDVNAADENGRTALMAAASRNHREAAAALIEAGADVNAADDRGRTALILAAEGLGEKDLAALLIEAGADVDAEAENGRTALHIAVSRGRSELVSILINQGAGVNARLRINGEEYTPLYLAAQGGYTGIFSTLIDAGAEPGEKGGQALWWAVFRNRLEMAETLINAGVDLNSRLPASFAPTGREAFERLSESTEVTPLIVAVYFGRAKLVSLLIDAGADVNWKDEHGRTALAHALAKPHPDQEIVQALRDAGAESPLEKLR